MRHSNINRRSALRTAAALALGALLTAGAAADGFNAENVELLSNITLSTFGASSGNDCWGYTSPSGREYALMGLNNKVAFVDITDPRNPDWFGSVPHGSTIWADIKVFRDHAYIVTEGGSGVQIVDMSDIDNHVINHVRTLNNPSSSHNVAIDTTSGFLYTTGSSGGSARTVIYDLNTDPGNPTMVGTWNTYEHDMQVVTYTSGQYAGREIMFGSSEGRGLDIVDVTNKAAPVLMARLAYPSVSYSHQAWTEDLQYLYMNDELDSINRTSVFDISDLNNPVWLTDFPSGTATDHNQYVHNGFMFEADYKSGVRISDLGADPVNPTYVGFFDTFPGDDSQGFDGAWSCFPFFPSGTLIVSDTNGGLFVLDPSAATGGRLEFIYPDGRPELINPAGGTTMRVDVGPGAGDTVPEPGTGVLHVDVGAGFVDIPMTDLGDNMYDAVFPAAPCGTTISFYVSAESTDGAVHTDPINAPTSVYTALSATSVDIAFEDDFETHRGWTVVNIDLQAGAWERGIPVGGGTRGDPPVDYDGSGQCYVTGNTAGDSDVDGGPTQLISPAFDLTNGDFLISYARWFANDDGDGDRLNVHVSNDGGSTWTLVESVGATNGWTTNTFRVADFVTPTDQVQVRFSATDNPNDSVTEAGIDAIEVTAVNCAEGTFLTDFSIVLGTLLDGDLSDLVSSDDNYVHTRSGFGATVAELHKMEMLVNANTTVDSPSLINLTFEDRISENTGTAKILLRNWNTNNFVQVGTYTLGMTENVVTIEDINAANYVSGSGDIDLLVRHIVFVPFLAFTFESFIDWVEIGVN